jgi:hypothetical protein
MTGLNLMLLNFTNTASPVLAPETGCISIKKSTTRTTVRGTEVEIEENTAIDRPLAVKLCERTDPEKGK